MYSSNTWSYWLALYFHLSVSIYTRPYWLHFCFSLDITRLGLLSDIDLPNRFFRLYLYITCSVPFDFITTEALSWRLVSFALFARALKSIGSLVKIPHTQGDVACNTYRNRYLKPTQPSRLGLPLALWFVRIQARCHLCSHNSTWKSFRVAAASGHLTGTAYGQAVKP